MGTGYMPGCSSSSTAFSAWATEHKKMTSMIIFSTLPGIYVTSMIPHAGEKLIHHLQWKP